MVHNDRAHMGEKKLLPYIPIHIYVHISVLLVFIY